MPNVRFSELEFFYGRGIEVQAERFDIGTYHPRLLEFLEGALVYPAGVDPDSIAINEGAIEEVSFRRLKEGTLSDKGMFTIEDADGCGYYDFCLITHSGERWRPNREPAASN